jgi:CRP/FNR family transcriptional regulator
VEEGAKMEKIQIEKLLSEHFEPWNHMSGDERSAMLLNSALVRYEKGATIHSGGNECVGVLFIKSGMLRMYMLSEEGKEITLSRMGHGDVCVLSASCVMPLITFDIHLDAEENTEVVLVAANLFSELTEKNIYVECFAYKMATERFSEFMWAMQQILFLSMDRRLAIFLWDELSKTEGDTIRLTHEQVAKYMGSAREVVTRMLKYFTSEGIVELSRGGIKILDKKRLRELAS